MPNIEVPADRDPMIFLWTERAAVLTGAAAKFSNTAYYSSTLSPREFEVVRMRIAQINACRVCQSFRARSSTSTSGSSTGRASASANSSRWSSPNDSHSITSR
jgi:alkylhydroperoxidase family enzyme